MASDNKKFYQISKSYPKNIKSHALKIQKTICFDALAQLIDVTPVDTSRAKGNWRVSIDQQDRDYEWGRYDNRYDTLSKGNTEISSMKDLGALYISNNIPYGHRILEEGFSKQVSLGTLSMVFNNLAIKYGFS